MSVPQTPKSTFGWKVAKVARIQVQLWQTDPGVSKTPCLLSARKGHNRSRLVSTQTSNKEGTQYWK